jgi:hypothetical protein
MRDAYTYKTHAPKLHTLPSMGSSKSQNTRSVFARKHLAGTGHSLAVLKVAQRLDLGTTEDITLG